MAIVRRFILANASRAKKKIQDIIAVKPKSVDDYVGDYVGCLNNRQEELTRNEIGLPERDVTYHLICLLIYH